MAMTTKKERAILEVSILWRAAVEHCGDEVYEEVKKLMELAVLAETDDAYIKLSEKFLSVESNIRLNIDNTERVMLYHWNKRNEEDKEDG